MAYATASPGGTVHLLHVLQASADPMTPHDVFVPTGPMDAADAARKRLLAEVPLETRGKSTVVHVLEAKDVAQAVCQAAERLGVDLVCLGTHGRSGAAKALLGSVAQEVLAQCRRPVLLTRTTGE
jgi:nucleotide-binding universal stress UspA family protein